MIALGRLQTLLLGWNALGDNGAVAIAEALLQNSTIHTLEMPWNKARQILWRVVVLRYRWISLRLRVFALGHSRLMIVRKLRERPCVGWRWWLPFTRKVPCPVVADGPRHLAQRGDRYRRNWYRRLVQLRPCIALL